MDVAHVLVAQKQGQSSAKYSVGKAARALPPRFAAGTNKAAKDVSQFGRTSDAETQCHQPWPGLQRENRQRIRNQGTLLCGTTPDAARRYRDTAPLQFLDFLAYIGLHRT